MNFAILFSGQGLQTAQHLCELKEAAIHYGIEPILRKELPKVFDLDITNLDLYHNEFAQPFIFSLQWCRWQKIRPFIENEGILAGYSLGELSALNCSTNIEFELGLKLAKKRAELMSNAVVGNSGLASVKGLNIETLNLILGNSSIELSIKLNDSSFIVGGLTGQLDLLLTHAQQLGAQVKKLNVSIPSHTSFMQTAVKPYQEYLNQHNFYNAVYPIISGIGGIKMYQSKQMIQSLTTQMDHPIDWDLCLESVKENMPDIVIEIGPGNALSKMMLEIQPNIISRSIDDFKSMTGLELWLDKFSF